MTTTTEAIEDLATALRDRPGALLPILHAVQDRFGYLPAETVPVVARVLNRSRADIHGVISFYHGFRETPAAQQTVYVCRSEACQSMGANALVEHARRRLNIDFHEVTDDGQFGLEPVYCLGNCACAPAIMIDTTVHGRVTADRWDELIDPA